MQDFFGFLLINSFMSYQFGFVFLLLGSLIGCEFGWTYSFSSLKNYHLNSDITGHNMIRFWTFILMTFLPRVVGWFVLPELLLSLIIETACLVNTQLNSSNHDLVPAIFDLKLLDAESGTPFLMVCMSEFPDWIILVSRALKCHLHFSTRVLSLTASSTPNHCWQGCWGSQTSAQWPAAPGEISDQQPVTQGYQGLLAQPWSQLLTYIVWIINALSQVTSIKFV